jgi:hypothetical protein
MATKYWEPKAIAVAQVDTVQVSGFDATTTYILTVNGVDLVSELGDTDANTTATNIAAAWEASAHPYATGITATAATDTVTLTADVAEVPFTVSSSVSGGAGTIGAVTSSTAPTGPHTLDEADNWDAETLPANDDTIVFRDSDVNVAWGLDGLSTTGHTTKVEQSYTGRIGLDWRGVATSADGATTDTNAPEYRPIYMTLDCSRIEIGDHQGIGNPGGSQRCLIDNDRASASQTVIYRTNNNGSENGKPPIRLKFANASADIDVRSGVCGVAIDIPGETSTIGDVIVRAGQVILGEGVTVTNWTQHGGNNHINLGAATLTQALVHGGTLVIDGDQAVTTLKVTGGTAVSNTTGTITTATHEGGTIDYSVSGEARTVSTHQLFRDATLKTDDDVVTITNLLEPDGPSTISVS